MITYLVCNANNQIITIIKGNMEMITKATIEGAEQAVTVALGLTEL